LGDVAARFKSGQVVAGKYRIERVLGQGGMGLVAAAWHAELGTAVALKVLLPDAAADDDAVERFAREARAASQLRSEHVVRVFDVGRLEDGTPYLVMERLDGEDLDELIMRQGPVDPELAVDYLLQACEGVAEAHAAGLVHRDLKPGNLFLTRRVDGRPMVKVVDFGLAKHQRRAANASMAASITAPLTAVGSPQYMSPEQTRAQDLDARSDIWSLGICLYELLTNASPFSAETVMDVCARVLTDAPKPPAALDARIPAGLSAVVLRCLQKEPSARYADVAALAAALEPFAPPSHAGVGDRLRRVLATPPPRPAPPPVAVEVVDGTGPSASQGARPTAAGPEPQPPASARPARSWSPWLVVAPSALLVVAALGLAWKASGGRGATASPPPASVVAPGTSPLAVVAEPPQVTLPASSVRAAASAGEALEVAASRASAARTGTGTRRGGLAARALPSVLPPEPVTAVAPAPAAPSPSPAAAPAAAPEPTPQAPRFALASARVEIGAAARTSGTTAASVGRAIAPLGDAMTRCYRTAIPQATGALDGVGNLHIDTDEEGVITGARATGPIPDAARCIGRAAMRRKVPNVDTGRASADIPLAFKSQ
jgi:serine/threonine-protein kinase